MQNSDYIFSIQNKDFAFWQIDKSGSVTISNKPYFLDFAPAGWESIEIANIRNKKYWGIDRSVSAPLQYVRDGAQILKHILYNLGIEETVYLTISKQELDLDTAPLGSINITTGGNLNTGNNTGTITGIAGSTVYVKLAGSPAVYTTGYIGTTLVSGIGMVIPVLIPPSGSIDYNIFSSSSANSLLLVNKSGNTTAGYGFWYKQIYRGEVDLSTFMHNGSKVTCTTLEDGLPKFLKANENTVYELPMNVPDAIRVKMDGINLHQTAKYAITDGVDYQEGTIAPSFTLLGEDGDSVGVLDVSQTVVQIDPFNSPTALANYINTSLNYFQINTNLHPVDINITGKVSVKFNVSSSHDSYLYSKIKSSWGQEWDIIPLLYPEPGRTYDYDVNLDITLQPGGKLFLVNVSLTQMTSGYSYTFLPNSNFTTTFITRQKTTYIQAFRPQYIFEQLINKVTEGNYSAMVASYFTTHSNVVFTCGNAIRGFDDAVLKINFSDFFQFWDCFDSVGMTEKDGKVNIDTKQKLIDRSNVIQLQPPGSGTFKISIAKEYLFNELEIGYPEIRNEIGVLNGNEEFNCKFLFSTGATKSPAKLDKVSKIKASCYEIELIRVTKLGKDTTDNKADNDLFVLHIDNTMQPAYGNIPEHYQLDRTLNATATGLIEHLTVFNLFLSPKRNLLRNGEFIRSSLYLSDGKMLAYKSSDKNNKVVCNGVTEKADVSVGSLGNRFFYPVLLDGNFPAPHNLISLLDLNPLQVFGFSVDGTYYEGILNKVSISPASRKDQAYQFYSVQDNDLSKLEFYYGG